MQTMRFPVGPFIYFVIITTERPVDISGQAVDGVIDFDDHIISIYHGVRDKRRLNLLLHELWHAKRFHLGVSVEEEADCDLSAAFMQQVLQELEAQGGATALGAMVPDGFVEPVVQVEPDLVVASESIEDGYRVRELKLVGIGDEFPEEPGDAFGDDDQRTRPEARMGGSTTADCADRSCGREFFASDVWTSSTRWCNSIGGRVVNGQVVERELYCPNCGLLQVWMEGWDPVRGVPNGVVVALLARTADQDRIRDFWRKLEEQSRATLQLGEVPA